MKLAKGKFLPLTTGASRPNMGSGITTTTGKFVPGGTFFPAEHVRALLDTVEKGVVVASRDGRVLMVNGRAKKCLEEHGKSDLLSLNIFEEILNVEPREISKRIESGEHEIELVGKTGFKSFHARLRWIPESDCVAIQFANEPEPGDGNGTPQPTVQELLQEREITYRNLLAAYLKLQEVNRQKTVFLASAAHELKTPLAVIKGYYDLLLTNSLGKLTDKQKDILEESKESCERLVRLVSMFLNYSALESGKLVLQLRENDLRDCIHDVTCRWQDAFQRAKVRLDVKIHSELTPFKFDYQKVQQCIANFIDNTLKHTPSEGCVTLVAEPHFWERRISEGAPSADRRRGRGGRPNSVLVSVSDTGSGIAAEFHQEIFEEFVRVDPSSSGMGLGLAITKRLIQAHRGKVWVDSVVGSGSAFSFLLPINVE
jgi:signal transduction histidine kinase